MKPSAVSTMDGNVLCKYRSNTMSQTLLFLTVTSLIAGGVASRDMNNNHNRNSGSNAWNRGKNNRAKHQADSNVSTQVENSETGEAKFQNAKEKLQASVQKHLKKETVDSSSDEDDLESDSILSSVLKNYSQFGGSHNHLGRTQQFLEEAFQSGAGICLICIASIRRADPIWSCVQCYGFFHLNCIQKWSRDSLFQQKQALEGLPEFRKPSKINWGCPKCRHEYEQSAIPDRYFCFCGQSTDPPHHPWLVPHSCGETCNKPLQPECGHMCLLLCHPGPCPPCPKTVRASCHCLKQAPQPRRCSDKLWSCGAKCGKALLCNKHTCEQPCHVGTCSSCPRESVQRCVCAAQQTKRPCADPAWHCDRVCGKAFKCGHHTCSEVCHRHEGDECPASLERCCPCGKTTYSLACTQEPPTCNDTCNKLLECGAHYCEQKCHRDACGLCREVVQKVCRCGVHKKEMSCQKKFLCETKCKRAKTCLRHPCNRKCCDGSCPPCEKPCGRTLPCGNHKCGSVCHQGPCFPCRETATVKCRCTSTKLTVPCGRKKSIKPPRCNKLCRVPPECEHPARERHNCHFGECPPCRLKCMLPHTDCAHYCPASCHTAVWVPLDKDYKPAGPWEAVQKMKCVRQPCPPCVVPMPVTCLGGHETIDYPCHRAKPLSCGRTCGQPLACANHTCSLECHPLSTQCTPCQSDCLKPRPEGCVHGCVRPCHPGPCPRCQFTVKVKCHCSVSTLYLKCGVLYSAEEAARTDMLSCNIDCPRTYPCGHPCLNKCHPGECSGSEQCRHKVKLTCPCGRLKKDVKCDVVRSSAARLECGEPCQVRKEEAQKAKALEMQKKKEEEERKNREELEQFEKKFRGKKKQRERNREVEVEKVSVFREYWFVVLAAGVGVVATAYYLTL